MVNSKKILVAVLGCWLVGSACGPTFKMTTPDGFVKYEEGSDFKMITADGVRLKARQVENYPRADIAFWKDALARHMTERGYAKKSEHCFKTQKGLDGCTLDFLLPYGADDWILQETIFIEGDRIVLVEVAGPFQLFQAYAKPLQEALLSFKTS
jgi:hypothetical protein